MKDLWRRRVVAPLAAQLRQGVTPRALALALALGLTIGAFPVLGTTTVLCALVAAGLRLNQPAIQVANYAAYPLQLALLLPFFHAGAWLFGATPVPFTLGEIRAAVAADALGALRRYAGANVRAAAAWAVVAVPAALLLYAAFRLILGRALRSRCSP
jgi:uncharacterized protein (DUF2062 family)